MYSYEIPKKLGYPKTVFYDNGIVFYYKDGREISIKNTEIDRIEYVKPSLWNYLKASVFFGGVFPGRMEIYLSDAACNSLLNRVNNSKMYLVKISYKNTFKLPLWCKLKMGYELY